MARVGRGRVLTAAFTRGVPRRRLLRPKQHEGTTGEATNLYGGLGSIVYHIGVGPARPYVLGSAGFAVHGYEAGSSLFSDQSEGKFTWGGGVGVSLALGGLNAFAEGRYLARSSDTQFIPLVVGLTFGGH